MDVDLRSPATILRQFMGFMDSTRGLMDVPYNGRPDASILLHNLSTL